MRSAASGREKHHEETNNEHAVASENWKSGQWPIAC